jgi:hypothetical protein
MGAQVRAAETQFDACSRQKGLTKRKEKKRKEWMNERKKERKEASDCVHPSAMVINAGGGVGELDELNMLGVKWCWRAQNDLQKAAR